MQYRASRQVVTGLTVNTKVNIRADYYRSARSMCNTLFKTGTFECDGPIGAPPVAGSLPQLEGILNHIYFVKHQEDIRIGVVSSHNKRHGIERLYGRFLFYKKFVALEKPVIVAEGKTDNAYLRAAIKHLPAFSGTLTTVAGGKTSINVSFFKHSQLTKSMLGLDGSSSYFSPFISGYEDAIKRYAHAPLHHPVIILIDNDAGAKGVFGTLRNLKINIDHLTSADFYPVKRNLYVVKTPEIMPSGYSQIEDLFDAAALATKLNGKTFNKTNDTDTSTEYGKAAFAEHVAANAAAINFGGFTLLLNRITAVIAYHQKAVAAGAV